ncbi:MAG: hypothetical protein OXH76_20845 [Boseongicola sp.]|nr:hypothetical protein [Boseongicola sp.]
MKFRIIWERVEDHETFMRTYEKALGEGHSLDSAAVSALNHHLVDDLQFVRSDYELDQ